MERSLHTERMRETAAVVIPLIRRAYASLTGSDESLALAISLFVPRRTRDGQALLRPYLVRLGYEVAGGKNWHDIALACAASEILNISTYQANVAFDGKLTVNSQEERAEQFACAMMSLEVAESMLGSMDCNDASRQRILRDLRITNRELYHGQMIDLRRLNVTSMHERPDMESFFSLYDLRCRKLGGELTRWCLMAGATLANADDGLISTLAEIGLIFGTSGQMVNDIGDLVPIPAELDGQSSNRYQVVFSDVRNGKLTYPLLYSLVRQDECVSQLTRVIREDEACPQHTLLALTQRLLDTGAFAATRKKVAEYLKQIRCLIGTLPPSQARDYLTLAATTVMHNKYFTALRTRSFGFSECRRG